MSDRADEDRATRQLDELFASMRHEEPDAPLRRDVVWSRVDAGRIAAVQQNARTSRRWTAAAAAVLILATGGALGSRWWRDAVVGKGAVVANGDPLLVNTDALLRAWVAAADQRATPTPPAVATPGGAPGTLPEHTALLLAATRAEADRLPQTTERARLLRDVEYVLAQVVEGAADDEIERALTLGAIRERRLLDRIADGGSQ